MAIDRNTRYPGRFDAPTTARPQGAFKNRSAPGAKDGSYLERDWANDWDGFFGSLLRSAGLTPNGTPDTALASQYFNALSYVISESIKVKITGDFCFEAGFANGIKTDPYFRHKTTNEVVPIATLEALNALLPKLSFSGNDFVRFPDKPGGLIVQWGSVSYPDIAPDAELQVSFPTPFPTSVFGVVGTARTVQASVNVTTRNHTNAGVAIVVREGDTGTYPGSVFWIAVGY